MPPIIFVKRRAADRAIFYAAAPPLSDAAATPRLLPIFDFRRWLSPFSMPPSLPHAVFATLFDYFHFHFHCAIVSPSPFFRYYC
jgi:hypothetical protein